LQSGAYYQVHAQHFDNGFRLPSKRSKALGYAMVFFDRLQSLPLLILFAASLLAAAGLALTSRAAARRLAAWYGLEPGTALPLRDTVVTVTAGIYGLLVAFTSAGIWHDTTQARIAVQREAQALENVLVLSGGVSPAFAQTMSRRVIDYVDVVTRVDWPLMAFGTATDDPAFDASDEILVGMLEQLVAGMTAHASPVLNAGLGQVAELRSARVARLALSSTGTTGAQWVVLVFIAFAALLAVAMTHVHERRMLRFATGIYGLVVGATFFVVLAHDRPFVGDVSVQPHALTRIAPKAALVQAGRPLAPQSMAVAVKAKPSP
jgi:Protein of unknown function (DUF4239)